MEEHTITPAHRTWHDSYTEHSVCECGRAISRRVFYDDDGKIVAASEWWHEG